MSAGQRPEPGRDLIRVEGGTFVAGDDAPFGGDQDQGGVMDDRAVVAQGLDAVVTHQVLDLTGVAGEEAMTGMVDGVAVGVAAQTTRSVGLGIERDGQQPDAGLAGQAVGQSLHAGGRSRAHARDPAAREDEIQRDSLPEHVFLRDQAAVLVPERHVGHQFVGHARDQTPFVDRLPAEDVGDFGDSPEFLGVGRDDAAGHGLAAIRHGVIADHATRPAHLAVALGESTQEVRRTIRMHDRRPSVRGDGNDLTGLGGGGKSDHGQEKEAKIVHVQRCSPEGPRSSSIMPCRTP
jgi:hypothetical protein